jgi:hypothetical protein
MAVALNPFRRTTKHHCFNLKKSVLNDEHIAATGEFSARDSTFIMKKLYRLPTFLVFLERIQVPRCSVWLLFVETYSAMEVAGLRGRRGSWPAREADLDGQGGVGRWRDGVGVAG